MMKSRMAIGMGTEWGECHWRYEAQGTERPGPSRSISWHYISQLGRQAKGTGKVGCIINQVFPSLLVVLLFFYHLKLCMVSNDEIPSPLDIRTPCLSSYLLGPEISSLAWLIIALSPPKGWAPIFCCGSKFPLLCHLLGLVCHHSLFTALGKCGTNWGSSLFLQEVAVLEG